MTTKRGLIARVTHGAARFFGDPPKFVDSPAPPATTAAGILIRRFENGVNCGLEVAAMECERLAEIYPADAAAYLTAANNIRGHIKAEG